MHTFTSPPLPPLIFAPLRRNKVILADVRTQVSGAVISGGSSAKSDNKGVIIAAAVGSVCAVLLVVCVALLWRKRKQTVSSQFAALHNEPMTLTTRTESPAESEQAAPSNDEAEDLEWCTFETSISDSAQATATFEEPGQFEPHTDLTPGSHQVQLNAGSDDTPEGSNV